MVNTVSHFSYAPFFQGPHFLTKMLESNILYDNLFIDMTSKKNIGITHANHSATSKAILTKKQKCTCKLNVHIFFFCFALVIIHCDRCDRKTFKTIILFKQNPLFWSLNLVIPLLFEEMLVLTSY